MGLVNPHLHLGSSLTLLLRRCHRPLVLLYTLLLCGLVTLLNCKCCEPSLASMRNLCRNFDEPPIRHSECAGLLKQHVNLVVQSQSRRLSMPELSKLFSSTLLMDLHE